MPLEVGQRDQQRRLGLLELGQQLGIVDRHQELAGRDVLAAIDRALGDPAIDARRDVDARGIGLALDQERLRLHQIPQRQRHDRRRWSRRR